MYRIEIKDSSHSILLQKGAGVIQAAPFVGKLCLDLEHSCLKNGVCFHLDQKRITYISSTDGIPEGTYIAILKDQNYFRSLICLSHQDLITSLGSGSSLNLMSGQSRLANQLRSALVIEEGKTLYEALERGMRLAIRETGEFGKLLEEKLPLPSFFNFLGWRSHPAFGKKPTHSKILHAIRSLKKEGFSIKYVLLDEGWQQLENKTLCNFEADISAFPLGIKGFVDELKTEGVERVGLAHAMMGCKGGLSGHLAKYYGFPPDVFGRYFPGYDLGKTFQFFFDYYSSLKSSGVSFVSVGDQESTSFYCRKGMDVTCLYKNLQTAIQGASSLNFQTAQLNSDCLRSENLFYWTNSRVANTTPSDTKSEREQIRSSLCHSVWLQHFMQPDFGTWDSHHETSALFQALSGSFNIIGDFPGESTLHKIVLPSGKILFPDHPLTICEDSFFVDPLKEASICKAFTKKERHGILAAFHLHQDGGVLKGNISPKDIPGLEGEKFALFSYRLGFMGVISREEKCSIHIQEDKSDIFTFSPINNGIAMIGYGAYILTMGPIINIHSEEDSMHFSSLLSGPILIYSERKVFEVRRNGQAIRWAYDPRRQLLSIEDGVQIVETPSRYIITFE